jgi:hypothetical protein
MLGMNPDGNVSKKTRRRKSMTEVGKWADWAYAKQENMRCITKDFYRYKPESARLAIHLAMGSTAEEATMSCVSPKVEIYVDGQLWRSTEEWKGR